MAPRSSCFGHVRHLNVPDDDLLVADAQVDVLALHVGFLHEPLDLRRKTLRVDDLSFEDQSLGNGPLVEALEDGGRRLSGELDAHDARLADVEADGALARRQE